MTRFGPLLPASALPAALPGANEDIRIAVAVSRTGTLATAGDQVVVGAQQAAKAIDARGGVDGAKVATALRQGPPVDTVLGPLRFDAKGDAEGITHEIQVWKGGKYARLE